MGVYLINYRILQNKKIRLIAVCISARYFRLLFHLSPRLVWQARSSSTQRRRVSIAESDYIAIYIEDSDGQKVPVVVVL